MESLFDYESLKNYKIPFRESYDYIAKYDFRKASDIYINEFDEFDIFLSHSYTDKEIIPELKKKLEDMGYTVYVDWIVDKLLSREEVTPETAKVLQKRMQQSKSLFFATSKNSSNSKWMPWELGYFDGLKNKKVAILPISTKDNKFSVNYKGQEYLGLYCWIIKDKKYDRLFNKYIEDIFIRCEINGNNISIKDWLKKGQVWMH